MALQDADTTYPLKLEVKEARKVADEAMNYNAHLGEEGKIHLREPREQGQETLAIMWLAAETRAARLERAYNRELDREKGLIG